MATTLTLPPGTEVLVATRPNGLGEQVARVRVAPAFEVVAFHRDGLVAFG